MEFLYTLKCVPAVEVKLGELNSPRDCILVQQVGWTVSFKNQKGCFRSIWVGLQRAFRRRSEVWPGRRIQNSTFFSCRHPSVSRDYGIMLCMEVLEQCFVWLRRPIRDSAWYTQSIPRGQYWGFPPLPAAVYFQHYHYHCITMRNSKKTKQNKKAQGLVSAKNVL